MFDDPVLITSLSVFSETRLQEQEEVGTEVEGDRAPSGSKSTTLFLKVSAAADFFSSNKTLMSEPPPVLVDLSKRSLLYLLGIVDKIQFLIHIFSVFFRSPCYQLSSILPALPSLAGLHLATSSDGSLKSQSTTRHTPSKLLDLDTTRSVPQHYPITLHTTRCR